MSWSNALELTFYQISNNSDVHFTPSHNCKYIEEMTQAQDDALAPFQEVNGLKVLLFTNLCSQFTAASSNHFLASSSPDSTALVIQLIASSRLTARPSPSAYILPSTY